MTLPRPQPTQGGQRGGTGLQRPPGERSTGRPSSPPPGAAPRPRPHAHAERDCADDTGGGRTPPERGAEARPAHPPQPPAPTGAAENKQARANAPGRRTNCAQRRRASRNRSGMGGHAPHGQHDTSDTRFVACPKKAEGRNEAPRPPALQAPSVAQTGGTAHAPPPSPPPGTRTPRTRPSARSPHRACRPRGQRRAPTPARPRRQHVDSGPQQPAQWAGSRGRGWSGF